jgi:hypothetical protein
LEDEDLQPEILEIVEAVRSPFDDGDLGLVLNDGFARGIGEPVLAVVTIPSREDVMVLITASNGATFASLTFANHRSSRCSASSSSRSSKMSSACSFSRYA